VSYTTWDTETTTHTSNKRKANPFDERNWVVTHGFKRKGGEVTEQRFGRQRPADGWFAPLLEGTRLLIGFNIKFDLLHALVRQPINHKAWMKYVASGGMIWDCQLAEYLLEGMTQNNHMLSLDEVAPRYGGNLKFDEVKDLWAAGVPTEDIEPALLTRYLIGGEGDMGDVENTEKIALEQIGRARRCGQLNSLLMNMGSLISTTEKELNGMFVDKATGLVMAKELEVEVKDLSVKLNSFLPPLPFEFNWGSPVQRSAFIFGGQVPYDRREYRLKTGEYTFNEPAPDTEHLYEFFKDNREWCTTHDGKAVTLEYAKANNLMVERYEKGKKAGEVKLHKIDQPDLDRPKSRMGRDQWTFPGVTAPSPKWKTESGNYSTASDVIEALGVRDIPFLKTMAEHARKVKDLGTYFIVTDANGVETGMLTLVDQWGVIHHMLNHTSTVTGRFSSSNPNLQNLPTGKKSKVKKLFISRFENGKIVQSDFASLEIYVQAILTGDKQLIADLKQKIDLHCMRLAAKTGKPYAEVVKLCKGYTDENGVKHEPDRDWDYQRTDAKRFSFSRAYGAGVQKIHEQTGMKHEDIEALIAAEQARYPQIDPYFEKLTKRIIEAAKAIGKVVPHPEVRGAMCNLKLSQIRTPDGKLYSYIQQPSPKYLAEKGQFASFSPTEIKNYVVQGSGGEWAKAAEYLQVRAFYARENFGGRALLVNQVHDAAYGDFAPEVAFEAACLLHACMEAASDYMEWAFKWPLPLPVPSDTTWAASMYDEESIPGLKERAAVLREELRATYMEGYRPSYLN